jgi:hypothetical protein
MRFITWHPRPLRRESNKKKKNGDDEKWQEIMYEQ